MFFVSKTCFMSFSIQNHAESFRFVFEKVSFGSETSKLNPKSEIWAHVGPARALEESGGPARALEEREKFRKNILFFYVTHFSQKSSLLNYI